MANNIAAAAIDNITEVDFTITIRFCAAQMGLWVRCIGIVLFVARFAVEGSRQCFHRRVALSQMSSRPSSFSM